MREVVQNPDLRRLQLAWVGSVLGNWGYSVAVNVWAYNEGGATAVGLLNVIRLVPSALAAPFVSMLGDRMQRSRVMVMTDIVRAVCMAAAALVIAVDGPAIVVFLIIGASAVVGTGFRPAQAALLPSLARTPTELTAANVASSSTESIGMFLGPALGGLLLSATSTEVVFLANGATFVWSALMVARIRGVEDPGARPRRPTLFAEASAGFRALAVDRVARLLVGLYTAQTMVAGMIGLMLVATALDLIDTGDSGVGVLLSSLGLGGVIGGVVGVGLIGYKRLGLTFALGLALFSAPLAAVAIWPEPAAALVFVAGIGLGNTIVDVSAVTLMQRTVPDDVMARVFGVMQSLMLGSMALGAVVGPILIEGFGIRAALAITGAFLPVLALAAIVPLSRLDRIAAAPTPGTELLGALPIFAPLPEPSIEQLASSLVRLEVPAGTTVFQRGDHGDRFYVVESGEVVVEPEDREARTLGAGEAFGEIALLRDVPRTATVTAKTDVVLQALERDDFIGVVTGDPQSVEAADAVIAANLGSVRAGMASA
jgi:MFS family permease